LQTVKKNYLTYLGILASRIQIAQNPFYIAGPVWQSKNVDENLKKKIIFSHSKIS
jgi:hypothetical protein